MKNSIDILKRRVRAALSRSPAVAEAQGLTRAAVLVPLVCRPDEPYLLATKRTMTVATHKGQISFPGGTREPEDRDAVENALREAREEVGLDPAHVEVVGLLDDVVTTTGFAITPVVGFVDPVAIVRPDPVEVEAIVEAPLAVLENPAFYSYEELPHENGVYQLHRYLVGEEVIWGATARIIHVFFTVLTTMKDIHD